VLLFRLKRLVTEREVLVGLVILGVVVMLADIASDLGWSMAAAIARGLGVSVLVALLVLDSWLRRRRQPIAVPLVFTEITGRSDAGDFFDRFVQDTDMGKAVRILRSLTRLRPEDLLIQLHRPNPRTFDDPAVWRDAWQELLREWDREVDRRLATEPMAREGRVYHVLPHVALPLAFALGASVGLRRSLVLYHYQEGFHRVLDLSQPRLVVASPGISAQPPKSCPSDLAQLPDSVRLILHFVISERHSPAFNKHPKHAESANAGMVYNQALSPGENWLPYVQGMVQRALPLVSRYHQVEICLICPSVVAFALGMALSRTSVKVCHWFDDRNQYLPVLSLGEMGREGALPFD